MNKFFLSDKCKPIKKLKQNCTYIQISIHRRFSPVLEIISVHTHLKTHMTIHVRWACVGQCTPVETGILANHSNISLPPTHVVALLNAHFNRISAASIDNKVSKAHVIHV